MGIIKIDDGNLPGLDNGQQNIGNNLNLNGSNNVRQPERKMPEINDDPFKSYNSSIKEERVNESKLIKDLEAEKANKKNKKSKRDKRREKAEKRVINSSPKTNEDYFNNYKKRVRNNRIKKITVYSTIIGFLVTILVMNIYFVFFREAISIPEIAAQVKTANKINNYPEIGVEGYLQNNAKNIISQHVEISNGTGAKTFTISDVKVNEIAVKSDSNANVYFSCKINTNIGTNQHNFLLPLYYDTKTSSFSPSGDLIVCSTQRQDTIEPIEASLWSFDNIKMKEKEEVLALTKFVDNFFEILYNNPDNDLSAFYSGNAKLGDYSCTYLGIQECSYYVQSNAMNLNCEVIYTLKSNEGIIFTVHNYLAVENDNGNFKIIHLY